MLCIQQEKISRFYYFSPYLELFCTIFIFPYKLQKITLLRSARWRLKELGAPVILRMKNHFIWSLPDTSIDEILIKQETAVSVTPRAQHLHLSDDPPTLPFSFKSRARGKCKVILVSQLRRSISRSQLRHARLSFNERLPRWEPGREIGSERRLALIDRP